MKLSPLAQGSGVPANSTTTTTSPEKMQRAKVIASGEVPQPVIDAQVERAQNSIKKIKMRTNRSIYRENPPEVTQLLQETNQTITPTEPLSETTENPNPDTIEAEPSEETRPLSPQFAALAKLKRSLQVKEREIAQREEALKSQSPAGSEDLMAKLKSNPLSVLEQAGVTYEQLTEAILNSPSQSVDPVKLRNEIKEELKKELLGEFSTRDEQQEKQVLSQIRREADAIVSEGEDYEAIRQARAQPLIVDLIHRTYKSTGEVMDTEEAAKLIENQLIEDAIPFAKIKKLQTRLTPQQEQVLAQVEATPKPNTKVMRTLTNRDSAQPMLDRRARAIAAMNGTFKRG